MKLLCCVILTVFVVTSAKRPRKFEGDFEFAEEDETKPNPLSSNSEKKKWIHDPDSDLCQPLHCKKREICLLEDALTAVCVSKKELHRNGDIVIPKSKILADEAKNKLKHKKGSEDDDDIFYNSDNDESDDTDNRDVVTPRCAPCPVITPAFICGTDNKTYSSICRLDYHNCIHQSTVAIMCHGFCPCKTGGDHSWKKQKRNERLGNLKSKYSKIKDVDNSIKKVTSNQLFADKYSFIPQDFKYENKHYKYIKYTKHDNNLNKINFGSTKIPYSEDKQKMRGYNDVLDKPSHNSLNHYKECSPSAQQTMGNRLLDWFSVIMADSKRRRFRNKSSNAYFPSGCKLEVKWMFQHLDTDADSLLSLQELYDLEHDENEHCIKPFLNECDIDRDIFINPKEWCRCFEKTERPCAAVRRRISTQLLGSYMPSCDDEGYYTPTQCHSATGMCWCVDKHGVEAPNSRIRGKPECETILGLNGSKSKVSDSLNNNSSAEDDDDDDDDDTDQSLEGSADQPLDF
nr:PREDICTED: proteoglycan Cow isoform X1 [Bemisia tabaci]